MKDLDELDEKPRARSTGLGGCLVVKAQAVLPSGESDGPGTLLIAIPGLPVVDVGPMEES
jgi:hypothetical protein